MQSFFLPTPRFKDIMIDSSLLGVEGTAQALTDIIKRKFHYIYEGKE